MSPTARTRHEAAAPLAVFDLDGTVADTRHRAHHLSGGRRDWNAFFAGAARDRLLPEGAAALRTAAEACRIVYLSGRPERLRRVTSDWLTRYDLPDGELLLRPDDSRVPATTFKLAALKRLARSQRIALLVDDDAAVVDAARASGLVAQVLLAQWQDEADPTRDR